jgi:hypothetical protein
MNAVYLIIHFLLLILAVLTIVFDSFAEWTWRLWTAVAGWSVLWWLGPGSPVALITAALAAVWATYSFLRGRVWR